MLSYLNTLLPFGGVFGRGWGAIPLLEEVIYWSQPLTIKKLHLLPVCFLFFILMVEMWSLPFLFLPPHLQLANMFTSLQGWILKLQVPLFTENHPLRPLPWLCSFTTAMKHQLIQTPWVKSISQAHYNLLKIMHMMNNSVSQLRWPF